MIDEIIRRILAVMPVRGFGAILFFNDDTIRFIDGLAFRKTMERSEITEPLFDDGVFATVEAKDGNLYWPSGLELRGNDLYDRCPEILGADTSPLFSVTEDSVLEACTLSVVKNRKGTIRTDVVIGNGLRHDMLKVGIPFFMRARPLTLDPRIGERQVCTSPLVGFKMERDNPLTYLLKTETGSTYQVVYGEEQ
jgi:hypothetical protein